MVDLDLECKLIACERTPGIARALRALGSARRRNKARIAAGQKPILGGRKVSTRTFTKRTGTKIVKRGGKRVAVKRSRTTRKRRR